MSEMTKKTNEVAKWPQIVAALAATLGSFGCGTGIAWSSPVLAKLTKSQLNESCFEACDNLNGMSSTSVTMIGPLFPVGAACSGPIAFFLLNKIGRKQTLIWLSVPMLVGYVLLTITQTLDSLITLFLGRFLTGLSGGAYALVAPYYVSEIAETSMRGALASLMQLMATFGVLFVDALNIYDAVNWVHISAICIAIPVAMVGLLFFMPDSPKYLISQNKASEAKSALQWLRGSAADVETELQHLLKDHEEESKIGSISVKQLLTEKVYLAPFLIAIFGMFGQQFCGINVVIFYLQPIFEKANSSVDPSLAAFLVALSQCAGTGVAVFIVDKFGRKILLILSDIFMGIPLAALGLFFYLDENKIQCDKKALFNKMPDWSSVITGPDQRWNEYLNSFLKSMQDNCEGTFDASLIESLGWLPIVSLITFMVAFSIGFGPLAWTLNAEIFSPEAKRLCSSIAFTANWTFAAIIIFIEPSIEAAINTSGAYFFFSAICLLGTFVILVYVPETKGKSPIEMRAYFENKKKSLKNHA